MKRSIAAHFLSAALVFSTLNAWAEEAPAPAQAAPDASSCTLPDTTGKLAACLQAVGSAVEDAANSDVLNDHISAIAEENPRLYIDIIAELEAVAQDDVLCQSLPSLQEKLERALSEEDAETPLSADYQEQAIVILNARADCTQKYADIMEKRPETKDMTGNFTVLVESQRLLSNIVTRISVSP
jgi:hypothetical protein